MLLKSIVIIFCIIFQLKNVFLSAQELEDKSIEHVREELIKRGLKPSFQSFLSKESVQSYGFDPERISPELIPKSSYKLYFAGVDTNNLEEIFHKKPGQITTTESPPVTVQGTTSIIISAIIPNTNAKNNEKDSSKVSLSQEPPKINQQVFTNDEGSEKNPGMEDIKTNNNNNQGSIAGKTPEAGKVGPNNYGNTPAPIAPKKQPDYDGFLNALLGMTGCIVGQPLGQVGGLLNPLTQMVNLELKIGQGSNCNPPANTGSKP